MDNKEIKKVYEDNDLVVIDKPAGVLVHPTNANEPGTVADWLLENYPDIKNLLWPDPQRPGIVHRLDKDTSGVMVLAKNPETLLKLQELFKTREIKKTYQALVYGKTPEQGRVEAGIVRDAKKDMMKIQETAYSFTRGTVRPAVTEYKALKHYRYKNEDLTLVECYPQTGRMHQIRLHLKHIGFPIIGDQLYFTKPSKRLSKELNFDRQFLHAVKLEFDDMKFESELAEDLKAILSILEQNES